MRGDDNRAGGGWRVGIDIGGNHLPEVKAIRPVFIDGALTGFAVSLAHWGVPVIRVHISKVMNTPAEVIEAEYPLMIESKALRQGSGGAVRHRGGEGPHRVYRVLCEDMSVTSMFERRVIPPYGLDGGKPGACFHVEVRQADGEAYDLPGKANIRLGPGDRVIVISCGGGGHGRPIEAHSSQDTAEQRSEPA